jgi:TRAP-type C4-dicarboxylate transport system permease small subunit
MFWKSLSKFSWGVTLLSLTVGTTIIIMQVFLRYIFGFSFSWVEELARYCMIYIGMIGGALALRENSHPSIDFIKKILTARGEYILEVISDLAAMIFAGLLIYGGYEIFIFEGFASRTPALRILWAYPYFSILLAGILLFLFSIERMIKKYKELIKIKNDAGKE